MKYKVLNARKIFSLNNRNKSKFDGKEKYKRVGI